MSDHKIRILKETLYSTLTKYLHLNILFYIPGSMCMHSVEHLDAMETIWLLYCCSFTFNCVSCGSNCERANASSLHSCHPGRLKQDKLREALHSCHPGRLKQDKLRTAFFLPLWDRNTESSHWLTFGIT